MSEDRAQMPPLRGPYDSLIANGTYADLDEPSAECIANFWIARDISDACLRGLVHDLATHGGERFPLPRPLPVQRMTAGTPPPETCR